MHAVIDKRTSFHQHIHKYLTIYNKRTAYNQQIQNYLTIYIKHKIE